MNPDLPDALPAGVRVEYLCPVGHCERCDGVWWTLRVGLAIVGMSRSDPTARDRQRQLTAYAGGDD